MNRLSPEHLSKWRAAYTAALSDYKRGAVSEYDAMQILMDLNFKHHALEAELFFFNRERGKWRRENGRNV